MPLAEAARGMDAVFGLAGRVAPTPMPIDDDIRARHVLDNAGALDIPVVRGTQINKVGDVLDCDMACHDREAREVMIGLRRRGNSHVSAAREVRQVRGVRRAEDPRSVVHHAWLAENLDHERKDHWSNGGDADGAASLNELRRQREMLKIDVSRLALARASGEVLERVAVQRFISARARTERDAWLAWASAASARLAAALGVDPGLMFAALENEVREQLRALADAKIHDLGRDNLA